MPSFTSREKYDKWKADRAKKLSQSATENDEGNRSREEKGNFSARCTECGTKIVDADKFCPHCKISLEDQDSEPGGELQHDKIYRKAYLRIKKEFSPGLIYDRTRRLIRTAIICLIVYSVISLFYGGKLFRKLNEKMYDGLTYAAEMSQNSNLESLSAIMVSSREEICSLADYLASQSDRLGIVDQYISSKKMEREREGAQIADDLKMIKKLEEEESGQQ
jgi:hypothetical protein